MTSQLPSDSTTPERDPLFQKQVQRLHRLTVYTRWLLVAILWIGIAPLCLWHLRSEFALWHDYFTWTAVRFSIIYNRLAALGLAICIGFTTAVLVWQSRNLLLGLPEEDTKRLEKQVLKIRQQGSSHPLWKWICKSGETVES